MPMFKYTCECGNNYSELAKPNEAVACPACGKPNTPSIPTGVSSVVMETRDSYRGKQIKKNNERQMRDRMNKHQDKYEMADRIDKFGMSDAVKQGWLKKVKKV